MPADPCGLRFWNAHTGQPLPSPLVCSVGVTTSLCANAGSGSDTNGDDSDSGPQPRGRAVWAEYFPPTNVHAAFGSATGGNLELAVGRGVFAVVYSSMLVEVWEVPPYGLERWKLRFAGDLVADAKRECVTSDVGLSWSAASSHDLGGPNQPDAVVAVASNPPTDGGDGASTDVEAYKPRPLDSKVEPVAVALHHGRLVVVSRYVDVATCVYVCVCVCVCMCVCVS